MHRRSELGRPCRDWGRSDRIGQPGTATGRGIARARVVRGAVLLSVPGPAADAVAGVFRVRSDGAQEGQPVAAHRQPPAPPAPSQRALAACRGRLRAAVAILAHATHALRDAVEARDRALIELREAERAQDVFVVAAVHELKTPLTAIVGRSQLLRRQARRGPGLDPDRLAAGLEDIDASAMKLAAALDALIAEVERPLPEPEGPDTAGR